MSRLIRVVLLACGAIAMGSSLAHAGSIGPNCGSCQGSIYTLENLGLAPTDLYGADSSFDTWRIALTIDTTGYSGGGVRIDEVAVKVSSSANQAKLVAAPGGVAVWQLRTGWPEREWLQRERIRLRVQRLDRWKCRWRRHSWTAPDLGLRYRHQQRADERDEPGKHQGAICEQRERQGRRSPVGEHYPRTTGHEATGDGARAGKPRVAQHWRGRDVRPPPPG